MIKNYEKTVGQVAAKIKALRMKAGYKSSETFANDHSLPRVQYWRMEKGTNFTLKTLMKVLAIHKMPISEFYKDIK